MRRLGKMPCRRPMIYYARFVAWWRGGGGAASGEQAAGARLASSSASQLQAVRSKSSTVASWT
eukprot:10380547-Lingulodinium_polyedra.AAC.1